MVISITIEDAAGETAAMLIDELSAELARIYKEDGSGLFSPADIQHPRAAFVVAWLDGAAVGCGALRPMPDDRIAEIKRMYVRAAARGKGLSRRILAKLEALARDFEYEATRLETGIHQHAAIGLYESAGYARIPCYTPYDNNPLSLCYEKRL